MRLLKRIGEIMETTIIILIGFIALGCIICSTIKGVGSDEEDTYNDIIG